MCFVLDVITEVSFGSQIQTVRFGTALYNYNHSYIYPLYNSRTISTRSTSTLWGRLCSSFNSLPSIMHVSNSPSNVLVNSMSWNSEPRTNCPSLLETERPTLTTHLSKLGTIKKKIPIHEKLDQPKTIHAWCLSDFGY